MREYIVTLKKGQDIDQFCLDMETEGGSLYIPQRAVICENRRPLSRSTHYLLTDEEADQLLNDERVLAVELTPKERGMVVKPLSSQYSTSWDKSTTQDATDHNWGLLRCVEGTQRSNWGSDGTTAQTAQITLSSVGKNVDVVIVDGHLNSLHPELALNADGSGGSRVVQLNWYAEYAAYLGTDDTGFNYNYNTGVASDNDHGQHVAGTVAGNTQGWARKANIYNISPYGADTHLDDFEIFDYIRAFHNNKPINPETGRRNPTICNNSWGYSYGFPVADVVSVVFRGVEYVGPFTEGQLNGYGIDTYAGDFIAPAQQASVDADMEDAIAEGIIIVGAASNDNMKLSVVGDADYNNKVYFDYFGSTYYIEYNQPGTPGSTGGSICVGAVSTLKNEAKGSYSNCGPRVDIWAPGTAIQSCLRTHNFGGEYPNNYFNQDSRLAGHYLGKIQGTSMASPQVCGVLACLLEQLPELTQQEALAMLIQYSGKNQMYDADLDLNNQSSYDLQGSQNRFLRYIRLRQLEGSVYPKENYKARPSSGATFPRKKLRYK
jgi:hypothetical protein